MKFTEGYWATREGVGMSFPTEIRDYSIKDGVLKLHVATRPVRHRGDTLDGPMLTFEYSSPFPDVIRTKIYHFKGGLPKTPSYALYREEGFLPDISSDSESFLIASGKLSLRIKRSSGWAADYLYDGKRITGNVQRNTALVSVAGQGSFMREQLDLGLGEYIYGLGERFTPFVKNGQSVDMWNEDGGTSSELSYKNVPFYLSNKGYGVFVNHSEKVSYEIGSEVVSKTQFSVPGEVLEYFVIGGGSMKSVLSGYTLLTGRPALPPAWSFGLWLTTSFTTSYDEQTVNSFIDGMAQRDLPLHVFHFDCFWMKESQWCDFDWDKDVFPDPEGMLKRLKEKGLRICVWINPYIAQKSRLFDEGMEKGYLVKRPDGGIWQWDRWQAGMGLVDFTNPEAVKWYKSELKRLMDMGVDCFKTDFGERIPVDVVWYDGSDPVKMHNYYSYLYNKAVFEVLEENRGRNEAMLFARSATAGGQKFPVHWGGDCSANYDSMAESLRGGLSLCSSGFGFWSHDISGFERTATPDIYKRWTAFGLLSSHSRLHGNESYRVPWLFDEEAVDVLRHFTKLKCRLMPYIYATACQASEKGIPSMRSMVMEFPEDLSCPTIDKQYMLGDSLLVAPIFNSEGLAQYYLPSGTWTNLLSGEVMEGGTWRSERYDYFNLPLLVRESAVIPFGMEDCKPDYDYLDGTQFHVFELMEGVTAKSFLTGIDGRKAEFSAQLCDGSISLEASEALTGWSAVLRGIYDIKEASGAEIKRVDRGMMVVPHDGFYRVVVKIG
ncbi:MAG: alpha-xylosidase [Eubacteriales bacterium]